MLLIDVSKLVGNCTAVCREDKIDSKFTSDQGSLLKCAIGVTARAISSKLLFCMIYYVITLICNLSRELMGLVGMFDSLMSSFRAIFPKRTHPQVRAGYCNFTQKQL